MSFIFHRCNQRADCSDNSDELNCELIHFPHSYLGHVPPQSITEVIHILYNQIYSVVEEYLLRDLKVLGSNKVSWKNITVYYGLLSLFDKYLSKSLELFLDIYTFLSKTFQENQQK